jgi:hypothetical protein
MERGLEGGQARRRIISPPGGAVFLSRLKSVLLLAGSPVTFWVLQVAEILGGYKVFFGRPLDKISTGAVFGVSRAFHVCCIRQPEGAKVPDICGATLGLTEEVLTKLPIAAEDFSYAR